MNSHFHLKTHVRRKTAASREAHPNEAVNPENHITPALIKSAYNLSSTSLTGAGETLALYELDGYTSSDVTAYASQFGLPTLNIKNVLVDGATGKPGDGADEVTVDIELMAALAPGARILVYEAPLNATYANAIDVFNRIVSDNQAKVVSTSWGNAENEINAGDPTFITSENNIFQQMAAQGQSMFSAAGDNGAYDDSYNCNNSTLEVDDPGSQPYVTSVGGTTLRLNSSGAYVSETSWATSAASGPCVKDAESNPNYSAAEGGGGGISTIWPLPSWQSGLGSSANQGSTTMRMVPDVSLDADENNSGYSIYYSGAWIVAGGTSCAAPLWAAFTGLLNQGRVAASMSRVGQFNPAIYPIAKSALRDSLSRHQGRKHESFLSRGHGLRLDDRSGQHERRRPCSAH